MTDLDSALWERMIEIVQIEARPFSYSDFVPYFNAFGQNWSIRHGTFRNKISSLLKYGKIDVVCYSPQAFYTLGGIWFDKPLMTPADHTGVKDPLLSMLLQQLEIGASQYENSSRRIANHPIYRVIQNLPFDRNALHDIRLRLSVNGIWKIFSIYSENYERFNPISKDILFRTFKINQLSIRVTIHRTDTISIVIGCSSCPVAMDTAGVIRLTNALRVVRDNLIKAIFDFGNALGNSVRFIIPDIMNWVVTMWHFGADASITYTGEKFSASWRVGQNALLTVYSKEWKRKGKAIEKRIRIELQESPKKSLAEALEDKKKVIEAWEEREGGRSIDGI